MAVSSRLPGVQFEVVAPPAPVSLVRMDIAVFVGFAASGPLQTPVAVEDIAHFEEIFGSDMTIATDPTTNQQVYALLPSSVRAFFRNGGRRCWVIRVAGPQAIANRFPIPGLFVLTDNIPVQAYAAARSEGSWSDTIAVGSALRSEFIEVVAFSGDPVLARLQLVSLDDVVAGDLLKLTFGEEGNVLWLFVDTITPVVSSPPLGNASSRLVDVTGKTMYWQVSSPPFSSGIPICERVAMDLFVQSDADLYNMTGLGCSPSHQRYWASLPSDRDFYSAAGLTDLWSEAATPRFPLAGDNAQRFFLPLEIDALPDSFSGPDLTNVPDAIVRDGVSAFDSTLFLDPSLSDSSSIDLMQEADYIRYQSSQSRSLSGIHAALAIEEASIIAVPDAVHRGWLQVSNDALAPPPASAPIPHPEWWHFLDCQQQHEIPQLPSAPLGQFQPLDLLLIQPPVLTVSELVGGKYSLSWTSTQVLDGYADFLEEAVDPEFVTAVVIYQGSANSYSLYSRPAGDYYYRVRRQVGSVTSDYSNGIGLRINGPTGWQVNPSSLYQDNTLLAVHTGLLRLCAARGDMFAVLAMPEHYRDSEAISHATELKSQLFGSEQGAYSFGALYHPWLIGHEEDNLLNLRSNPPDGAMAGVIAMRSAQRGPWISPANEPLHGVVDMTPSIARSSRQALQDSLINLVRQEPDGFLCLCELTLSDDPDLSSINVRRLLSFLRKTALRVGVNYVFEPNTNEFRRSVQRGFEILFDKLLLLGAFAGRTSREAYQVVTDSTVNTRQTADNGQFVVELRVAPSVPLRFLTVRLTQSADRTFVTEGGA